MDKACITKKPQGLSVFEKYLTAWVLLCIAAGIVLVDACMLVYLRSAAG